MPNGHRADNPAGQLELKNSERKGQKRVFTQVFLIACEPLMLIQVFSILPDPRICPVQRHDFKEMSMMTLNAVLCCAGQATGERSRVGQRQRRRAQKIPCPGAGNTFAQHVRARLSPPGCGGFQAMFLPLDMGHCGQCQRRAALARARLMRCLYPFLQLSSASSTGQAGHVVESPFPADR